MTLKELKQNHGDVIHGEMSWEELSRNANGAALFYASLSGGNRPKDERRILWAGYVLTAGITAGDEILILRMTSHGNAKLDAVPKSALEPGGRAVLFKSSPVPEYDRRNLESWDHWD